MLSPATPFGGVVLNILKQIMFPCYRVIESKNENYPVGKLILASLGWRTHTVCNPDKMSPSTPYSGIVVPAVTTPANIGTQPQTTTLGVLGMPG